MQFLLKPFPVFSLPVRAVGAVCASLLLALAAWAGPQPQAADAGQAKSSKKAAKESGGGGGAKSNAKQNVAQGVTLRPGYRLASGDVVDISVWKEPDASVTGVLIRADGNISLPFLREVKVAGLTPAELEEKLTKDLSKVVKDPEVTVLVRQVNSEKVYVIGAVRKPGPINLPANLTILQVLTEAGGPTDFAKKKKIYILRNGQKIMFNYDEVIKGEKMETNVLVLPGDTIVVPQ